jgi:hypothetical protein
LRECDRAASAPESTDKPAEVSTPRHDFIGLRFKLD